MAKKLSQKQIDGMFKVYCEKQSSLYVSKKCAISRTTVDKYKRLQDWDGRLVGIQHKAQEKQDNSLANALAANLKIVQFAKKKIIEFMTENKVVGKSPVSDLDKAIRLELLLRGEADSRTAIIDSKLKDVPTEALLKMQEELGKENDKNASG